MSARRLEWWKLRGNVVSAADGMQIAGMEGYCRHLDPDLAGTRHRNGAGLQVQNFKWFT